MIRSLVKPGSKPEPRQTQPEIAAQEHGSGRPRDDRVDTEVVSAVLQSLRSGGYGAVTIDGIARKVKRARTTIYRRWPSKRHLVAYAVVSEMGDNPAAGGGIWKLRSQPC
jgi:AcrR family transcriptional regulator